MKRQHSIFLLLPVLLTSCYTYKIFPKEYRDFTAPAASETVYIINSELKKEAEILKASGIYDFTSDSSVAVRIKLHPLKKNFACGQPLTGIILFLGQLPSYLPDRYQFSYEVIENNEPKELKFELQLATRYWFWDIFSKKDFTVKAGKTLAGNFYKERLTVVNHQ